MSYQPKRPQPSQGRSAIRSATKRQISTRCWAVSGKAALLILQFALPDAECRAVYAANPLYEASVQTIDEVSPKRDGIFRGSSEAELAAQTLALTGDPVTGYRATGRVGLVL